MKRPSVFFTEAVSVETVFWVSKYKVDEPCLLRKITALKVLYVELDLIYDFIEVKASHTAH